MKVTLSLQQDGDATSCNWPKINEIVHKWSAHFAERAVPLPVTQSSTVEFSLELAEKNIIQAIRTLHKQLYDFEVNFTVIAD